MKPGSAWGENKESQCYDKVVVERKQNESSDSSRPVFVLSHYTGSVEKKRSRASARISKKYARRYHKKEYCMTWSGPSGNYSPDEPNMCNTFGEEFWFSISRPSGTQKSIEVICWGSRDLACICADLDVSLSRSESGQRFAQAEDWKEEQKEGASSKEERERTALCPTRAAVITQVDSKKRIHWT